VARYRWIDRPVFGAMECDDWIGILEVHLVPRVPEDSLETVVFLYPGRSAAEKGLRSGGGASGFMVAQPFHGRSDPYWDHHMYVVTSRHCVEGNGPITVRASAMDAKGRVMAFLDTTEKDWHRHKDYDVAICLWKEGAETVAAHTTMTLLTQDQMYALHVGPGEDCYVVTRFMHQDGGTENHPIVHSGMVAKLPLDPIRNPHTKKDEYDFLVEMHSRSGYSGSPVTLYIIPGEQVTLAKRRRNIGPQLLIMGVMWGHIRTHEPVLDPRLGGDKRTGEVVAVDTMVAGVVPAWEVMALLNRPDVVAERLEWESEMRESKIAAFDAIPESEVVTDCAEATERQLCPAPRAG